MPFVFSFWLILLPSDQLLNLGLTQRNIFWMNEMYAIGGKKLLDLFQTIDTLPVNEIVSVYLRSLSSIVFQDNLIAGLLIALALLVCSRIAFLLSLTGFLTACIFAQVAGYGMTGMSFYNIGANYILVAIAAGGFFVIPSKSSFLWVVLLIPLTSLLILFLKKLFLVFGLPLFSLPFSFIVIVFLYFLMQRIKPAHLVLTPYQYYSPEINLYSYRVNVDRNTGYSYFPLHLPFWGEWTVSQGYDGKFTHKDEWSKAIDFLITDESGNTHSDRPASCEDYLCYNKRVLSPGDGVVAEIIDNVGDNEPGKVNAVQNWGNTIIIRHLNNLYTQISHLRAGSFNVKKGDVVHQGDILGLCGNSGRSPEPHIHFQVQASPLPGAKPIEYPVSYYFRRESGDFKLNCFSIPREGERVSNVLTASLFKEAYDLQPGIVMKFRNKYNKSAEKEVTWEVFTDAFNYRYIYCRESKSYAYFVNDGTMFSFTSFYGDRKSLLYFFYLTSYKILLGYYENLTITDIFPLHIVAKNRLSLGLHDFVAPFHQFIKACYTVKPDWSDSPVNPGRVRLLSDIRISGFFPEKNEGSGTVLLERNRISEFSFESLKHSIWASRTDI